VTDPDTTKPNPKWPIWAGIFVALGSLATVAYAFIESWWG
jgi:hypothetical protein